MLLCVTLACVQLVNIIIWLRQSQIGGNNLRMGRIEGLGLKVSTMLYVRAFEEFTMADSCLSFCLCVCVCMLACVCVHTCLCAPVRACARAYACVCVCVWCVCVFVCVFVWVCVCECVCVCVHSYVCMCQMHSFSYVARRIQFYFKNHQYRLCQASFAIEWCKSRFSPFSARPSYSE